MSVITIMFLFRFPVSGLCDGKWHHIAFSVSSDHLRLYVDCLLLESVDWVNHGLEIGTDGLLMVGGILEAFEAPFEVSCFQSWASIHSNNLAH